MKLSFRDIFRFVPALAFAAAALPAQAAIANGGFESGLTGWTIVDQVGSDATFLVQSGTQSPLNGFAVPAPPGGTNSAMTDAQGPGSHVLFQDFTQTVAVANATLEFDLFIGNRADSFVSPNTLDFATPQLNQQARVDILGGSADPFSLALGDTLLSAYQTNPGDPLIAGYIHRSIDVTGLLNANLNSPLRLRFAEVDNLNTFNLGVDNVNLVISPIPEPASWLLMLVGLTAVARFRRAFGHHQ